MSEMARRFGPHAEGLKTNVRPTAQPAKPPRKTEPVDSNTDMISISDVIKIINDTASNQPFVHVDKLKQAFRKA